jgi:hypothetical protein
MQHVVVFDLLVRIKVEPALAALLLRPRVPGDGKRLQATIGKLEVYLISEVASLPSGPSVSMRYLSPSRKKRDCTSK